MRELKFRVWDKENSCFFKPTYEAYKGRLEDLSISLSGDLTMHTYDTPFIHESCFPNRFVIQQYTGLKDRNGNGKETYEGDIIQSFEQIGIVKYELGVYYVEWINEKYKSYLSDVCRNGEVIGNIYENPELLQ